VLRNAVKNPAAPLHLRNGRRLGKLHLTSDNDLAPTAAKVAMQAGFFHGIHTVNNVDHSAEHEASGTSLRGIMRCSSFMNGSDAGGLAAVLALSIFAPPAATSI